jgi:hypothetical protein
VAQAHGASLQTKPDRNRSYVSAQPDEDSTAIEIGHGRKTHSLRDPTMTEPSDEVDALLGASRFTAAGATLHLDTKLIPAPAANVRTSATIFCATLNRQSQRSRLRRSSFS